MTFVGNSPVEFENIIFKSPMNSMDLADELRKNDIYISASRNEPCSNAILEAQSCGLPVIIRNQGGNPEIIEKTGLLFDKDEEIPELIKIISKDIGKRVTETSGRDIKVVAEEYIDFFEGILSDTKNGKYKPKLLSFAGVRKVKKTINDYENDGSIIKRTLKELRRFF